ncbi:MAG: SUF system NifU family Fe-S cluster assembly protein [Candidatus Phytoplasma stylosanthis]|uniref:Fe-S cluster assembly sulfur transfer protein SufU n=1 Tax=Candidatus Phytoplasma stylosanthis TaxID=2798314 RepID=UPI00293A6534|nr:SUF system NifU family Fe-S cluster assembly protein [Candidatus Phytoplasma stylosanthis]MDV3167881.1 SUF system NifU family Fe-S cluster assembly protein [Candidatus Phytoplasma stylosanthis]MDV3170716.1 SUF system NifU family Fe-S cluster assembly protein [Candidatus Phytoplasma stylosanthis]MDV3173923.1 SUF system NifU family Fe-S cluster assembly protein [Candidatus Phytoplasma stylosanthis]MDV3173973.1 SUF system NifU family Fe-S cluster assembly protein [Candidatus Phytoplasma stylosa
MNNINELYRNLIIKHYHKSNNKGLIKKNNSNDYLIMEKKNISCSDRIILQVKLEKQIIVDIKYETEGCIILTASASLMSIYLKNQKIETALRKKNIFINMLKNNFFKNNLLEEELQIFLLVKKFPGKVICASMPWNLLEEIILNKKN